MRIYQNVSVNYIKKEDYTGSYRGMRYKLKKQDDKMCAYLWPGPYCFEKTKEEMATKEFELSQDGVKEALVWLEEQYTLRMPLWESVHMH